MNRCTRERGTGLCAIPFVVACVGLFSLFATSCQTHESGVDLEGQVEVTSRAVGGARLDEQELAEVGLETLWFNPPPAGEHPVTGAYLVDDGLFLATQPVRGVPGKLKKLSRADGMVAWYYDLEGLLTRTPSAYRYPPTRQPGSYNELYIVVNDSVHCLGLQHGDLLWKQSPNFTVSTRVVANEQRFCAGSENGRVYGVLKNQSMIDWTHLTGNFVEADPVADATSVYVGSNDGTLYRFSGASGWREGFSWSFPTGARITATPVLFAGWVIAASADYKLYCINTSDGSKVWSFLAEAPLLDTPVVYSFHPGQEYVYCIATDKRPDGDKRTLFSVRMRGGTEQWRFDGVRKVVSMGRKNLYVLTDAASSRDRALVAIDVLSGKEQFRLGVDRSFRFVPTNDADHGRKRTERGRIYLVGADGAVQLIGER